MEIRGNYNDIMCYFNDELNYAKNDNSIDKEWVSIVEEDAKNLLLILKDIKLKKNQEFLVEENSMGGFIYEIVEIEE